MGKRRLSATERANKRINVDSDHLCIVRDIIARLNTGTATDETVEQLTAILHDLAETRFIALAVRANILYSQGKLSDAIQDATRMIEAKPMSIQGYLAASDMYITQNRYRAAISVLSCGLRRVSRFDQPVLHEKREAAQQSLAIKVDFVVVMPREITGCIFERVFCKGALFSATLVSKGWRASILSFPSLWKHASDSNGPNAGFRLLPSVSKHLTSIDIDLSSLWMESQLSTLAANHMFPALTVLSIRYGIGRGSYRFPDLIAYIGRQLKDLRIQAYHWCDLAQHRVDLDYLLSVCMNLKCLIMSMSPLFAKYDSSLHPNPHPLETLSLKFRDESAVLEQLLTRCPRLRVFSMPPYIRSAVIQKINQHCPLLQNLDLAHFDKRDSSLFRFRPPDACDRRRQQPTGLQRLFYSTTGLGLTLHDLIPLLLKSRNALEYLYLHMGAGDYQVMHRAQWSALAAGPYPHVTSVDLLWSKDLDGRIETGIARLLRACPALALVRIDAENVRSLDAVFASLVASSHLASVTLHNLTVSLDGLHRLLNHHVTCSKASQLRQVKLYHCSAMTDACICTLARVPCLERLAIDGPLAHVTPNGVHAFLQTLGGARCLKSVALMEVDYLEDDSVQQLQEATGLERRMFSKLFRQSSLGERQYYYSLELCSA